ncbi:CRISPR-associated endonuclease Cas2 [Trichlorobacter sp.]|uniref:CRISPR-associated endonuclease Cas2 n=1 Tax=Trichlorobacter sp. TaxID=2911007 RepID=UPI002A363B55|nr:CRISPR-associated endonuclease Cas2 [Trichlorobacter sp.]
MSYRFMRLLLFFDLPVETASQQKEYRHFVKSLEKEGFMRLQYSVYCKLTVTQSLGFAVKKRIKSFLPKKGYVMILMVTEKQYSEMDFLLGEKSDEFLNDDHNLVFL